MRNFENFGKGGIGKTAFWEEAVNAVEKGSLRRERNSFLVPFPLSAELNFMAGILSDHPGGQFNGRPPSR